MIDDGEPDDKLIAVPIADPRWNEVKDLGDINKHTLKEIEHFFSTYKNIQEKEVKTNGFKGAEDAKSAYDRSLTLYNDKYASK